MLTALGIAAIVTGVVLAIIASLKAAEIRRYVIRNELATDLTRSYYLANFHFPAICAMYVKTTGDRASARIAFVAGLLGLILFAGGAVLTQSQFTQ